MAAPLAVAPCTIEVDGHGLVGIEQDYLPRVVMCENGGAGYEALKAQAIAARSVAYYAVATSGSICDGQGCQVFSCGLQPSAAVIAAVAATSRQYLMWHDTLTYGFYVAGDSGVSEANGCLGANGATEKYVTYNAGKTGEAVQQTTLGFVFDWGDPGYGQNRGCMSQWGARCLEDQVQLDHAGILRWFYGQDIAIVTAPEDCDVVGEEGGEGGDEGIPPPDAEDSGGGEEAGDGEPDADGQGDTDTSANGDGVADDEGCPGTGRSGSCAGDGDTHGSDSGHDDGSGGGSPGSGVGEGEEDSWGLDHDRSAASCAMRRAQTDPGGMTLTPWLSLMLSLLCIGLARANRIRGVRVGATSSLVVSESCEAAHIVYTGRGTVPSSPLQ